MHTDPGVPLRVGTGVTIGHAAMIHGATLEDGCLIGLHATVLNGAVVGAQSLIAAGALVKEGQVIPPGVLAAGVPAKVVRELDDAARARPQPQRRALRGQRAQPRDDPRPQGTVKPVTSTLSLPSRGLSSK